MQLKELRIQQNRIKLNNNRKSKDETKAVSPTKRLTLLKDDHIRVNEKLYES